MNKLLQDFKDLCATAREYAEQYEELLEYATAEKAREECSRGGEEIHRGVYCPSPIQDLIIGGLHRGRLLKGLPRKEPSVRYLFGADGQLLCSLCWHRSDFIVSRTDTEERSVEFSDLHVPKGVSLCIYAGNVIQRYLYCSLHPIYWSCRDEVYTYCADQLSAAEITTLTAMGDMGDGPLCVREKYVFAHDENGFISRYWLSSAPERQYAPSMKRKI